MAGRGIQEYEKGPALAFFGFKLSTLFLGVLQLEIPKPLASKRRLRSPGIRRCD